MLTAKSTFSDYAKPTDLYYDPEQEIMQYEQTTGRPICEFLKKLIRDLAPIVNTAYKDGLRDGRKEAKA